MNALAVGIVEYAMVFMAGSGEAPLPAIQKA
jgi:hypothetical protein